MFYIQLILKGICEGKYMGDAEKGGGVVLQTFLGMLCFADGGSDNVGINVVQGRHSAYVDLIKNVGHHCKVLIV